MSELQNKAGGRGNVFAQAGTLGFWGSAAATAGFSNALLYSAVITSRLGAVFPGWTDKLLYILFLAVVSTGAASLAGIVLGALWRAVTCIRKEGSGKDTACNGKRFAAAVFATNLSTLTTQAAFWLVKYYHRELTTRFWLCLAAAVLLIALAMTLIFYLTRKLRPVRAGRLGLLIAVSLVTAVLVQVFYVGLRWDDLPGSPDTPAYYARHLESGRNLYRDRPKNVILVILDALRADHLSLYGYPVKTSPFLDSLGLSGVVFDNAYCQWNYTRVSMPSMFTSIYPRISGVVEPKDFETKKPVAYSFSHNIQYPYLTEILSREGWHTAMLLQNPWVPKAYRTGSVCDYYEEIPNDSTGDTNPALMLQAFERWQEKTDTSRPFFLFMHFLDPHDPYTPSDENIRRVYPEYDGARREFPVWDYLTDRFIKFLSGDEKARRQCIARYDGEILNSDIHLEVLFRRLWELGVLDSTLVIITSDHGELLGEKNDVYNHGSLPYQGSLRVPLIMCWPGLPQRLRIARRVELVDLMPTILDGLEVRYDGVVNGKSLLPMVFGEPEESFPDRVITSGVFNTCLISGDYKLTFNEMAFERQHYYQLTRLLNFRSHLDLLRDIWGKTGRLDVLERWSLYDLAADPAEERNLFEELPEVAAPMAAELGRYHVQLYRVDRSMIKEEKMSAEEIERLKALGYIR
ncbi:MAG: sulfatase-like hydrolase/transferase [Candidatus Glassbacteria bacterium]|nr:sulfatase-like hydrolase/transferase [Candidatus Glassbacteria bacterium]